MDTPEMHKSTQFLFGLRFYLVEIVENDTAEMVQAIRKGDLVRSNFLCGRIDIANSILNDLGEYHESDTE